MSDNRNFQMTTPATPLDNFNLKLWGPNPNAKKSATFSLRMINGNPRIYVYLNEDNDPKPITAKLGPWHGMMVVKALRACAASAEPAKHEIEVSEYRFFSGGAKSDKPELMSSIIVGRDSKGVYIALVDKVKQERTRVQFYFGASRFMDYKANINGVVIEKDAISAMFAESYADLLAAWIPELGIRDYKEAVKKDNNGGGGNNYNRGGSGGGQQQGGGNRNYNNNSGGGQQQGGNRGGGAASSVGDDFDTGAGDDDGSDIPF